MAELRYDGKVAVITGSGHGLGRSHALTLASRGAKVVVNDLGSKTDGTGASHSAADEVVNEIKAKGGEAVANYDSVATEASAANIIKTAIDAYGRVDILINNAGILRDKSFKNMSAEEWQAVIDVHLVGTMWMTKAAWKYMYEEQQYGRIINTTSAAGLFGNFGQTNYAAAKMGIVGMSLVWAQEGAKRNIKVNVLAPGARTRMTEDLLGPLAEQMHPELVTPIVAYLAHEDCPVTGEIFSAAGGRVARIFIGACLGYYNKNLTVEDVRDNFAKIEDMTDFLVPRSAMEEMGLLMKVAG